MGSDVYQGKRLVFTHLSVNDAAAMILAEQAQVVDIRDPETFAQGHIPGAVHVNNNNFQDYLENADKTKPLIVCCYHGHASQPAADLFNQHGFGRSYSMDGGMCEWALTKQVVPGASTDSWRL